MSALFFKLSRKWDRSIPCYALHKTLSEAIAEVLVRRTCGWGCVKRPSGADASLAGQATRECEATVAAHVVLDTVENIRPRYVRHSRRADDAAVWSSAILAL